MTSSSEGPEPQHISRALTPQQINDKEIAEQKHLAALALERRTKWRTLGAVVGVLLVLWFFRWDVQVRHAEGAMAIMVNRFTGEVRVVFRQTWVKVEREE